MLGAKIWILGTAWCVTGEDVGGGIEAARWAGMELPYRGFCPERKHYHLIPGTGTMDWAGLKAALEAAKYERFLTVELYTYPDRPAEAAEESLAYLETIFGEE